MAEIGGISGQAKAKSLGQRQVAGGGMRYYPAFALRSSVGGFSHTSDT
jgi:hypothetical protein